MSRQNGLVVALVPVGKYAGKGAIRVRRGVSLVGGAEVAQVRLASRSVEAVHAMIVVGGDGRVFVRDLASQGGVLVNGEGVRERELAADDRLGVGSFEFRVSISGEAAGDGEESRPAVVRVDGEEQLMVGRVMVIGRRSGCDVVVSDPQASRVHAAIVDVGGGYVVRDLGSRGGTFVDGEKVHERKLEEGDEIGVGVHKIGFELGVVTAEAGGDLVGLEDSAVEEAVGVEEAAAPVERPEVEEDLDAPISLDLDLDLGVGEEAVNEAGGDAVPVEASGQGVEGAGEGEEGVVEPAVGEGVREEVSGVASVEGEVSGALGGEEGVSEVSEEERPIEVEMSGPVVGEEVGAGEALDEGLAVEPGWRESEEAVREAGGDLGDEPLAIEGEVNEGGEPVEMELGVSEPVVGDVGEELGGAPVEGELSGAVVEEGGVVEDAGAGGEGDGEMLAEPRVVGEEEGVEEEGGDEVGVVEDIEVVGEEEGLGGENPSLRSAQTPALGEALEDAEALIPLEVSGGEEEDLGGEPVGEVSTEAVDVGGTGGSQEVGEDEMPVGVDLGVEDELDPVGGEVSDVEGVMGEGVVSELGVDEMAGEIEVEGGGEGPVAGHQGGVAGPADEGMEGLSEEELLAVVEGEAAEGGVEMVAGEGDGEAAVVEEPAPVDSGEGIGANQVIYLTGSPVAWRDVASFGGMGMGGPVEMSLSGVHGGVEEPVAAEKPVVEGAVVEGPPALEEKGVEAKRVEQLLGVIRMSPAGGALPGVEPVKSLVEGGEGVGAVEMPLEGVKDAGEGLHAVTPPPAARGFARGLSSMTGGGRAVDVFSGLPVVVEDPVLGRVTGPAGMDSVEDPALGEKGGVTAEFKEEKGEPSVRPPNEGKKRAWWGRKGRALLVVGGMIIAGGVGYMMTPVNSVVRGEIEYRNLERLPGVLREAEMRRQEGLLTDPGVVRAAREEVVGRGMSPGFLGDEVKLARVADRPAGEVWPADRKGVMVVRVPTREVEGDLVRVRALVKAVVESDVNRKGAERVEAARGRVEAARGELAAIDRKVDEAERRVVDQARLASGGGEESAEERAWREASLAALKAQGEVEELLEKKLPANDRRVAVARAKLEVARRAEEAARERATGNGDAGVALRKLKQEKEAKEGEVQKLEEEAGRGVVPAVVGKDGGVWVSRGADRRGLYALGAAVLVGLGVGLVTRR